MSKKDKIRITRPEDFSVIDTELADAMEQLEATNTRIETLLQTHAEQDPSINENPEPAAESDEAPRTRDA